MLVRPLRTLLQRALTVSYHSSSGLLAPQRVTHRFNLADIGEGITECEIVKWYVEGPAVTCHAQVHV